MISTTHADLRIRAHRRGIQTAIIHGASIASAVCGISGLQNYRFGKSCSLPFPEEHWYPLTPAEVIRKNLSLNLHTLVYLDIREDTCMTVHDAVPLLEEMSHRCDFSIPSLRWEVQGQDHQHRTYSVAIERRSFLTISAHHSIFWSSPALCT